MTEEITVMRSRHTRWPALLAALILSAVTTGAGAQDGGFTPPPARVETARAELREMAPSVEASGTVVSLNDSNIASEIEGVLTWLADVGTGIDEGDVIARIDPRLISIEVRRAEANASRLAADFDYRQRQLERTEELAAKSDRTDEENEELGNKLSAAREQLQMADLLGYGENKNYKSLYSQLDDIEKKTDAGKFDQDLFDRMRSSMENLLSSASF